MATVIRGSDGFDSADNASQTELDNLTNAKNQCTAWVNFDGATATIIDSYNVSSVVRVSVGNYDIYFTTSMNNLNWSVSGSSTASARMTSERGIARTVDKSSMDCFSYAGAAEDRVISLMYFGGK